MSRSPRRRLLSLAATVAWVVLCATLASGQMPEPVTGDPVRGAELYKTVCAECHGENAAGIQEKFSPSLHQQEDWYLLRQLDKFRTGIRGSIESDSSAVQMREKVLALPDEAAMSDVVAYIKTIDGPGPPPATIQGDVEAGRKFYESVCIACHGPDGRGMAAVGSASLVGQSDWYVVMQITKFRNGLRGADPRDVQGIQMKAMMATLPTEQTVLDVASYVATLR